MDIQELKVQPKHKQVCVGKKAIKWPMITQLIEGKDGISHEEFNRYLGRAQNVDDDHDTFIERFHEDIIAHRRHQAKGRMERKVIETTGTTHTRNQACCSRQNDMARKVDVSLAHHRKLCFEKKDQVAQLKVARY